MAKSLSGSWPAPKPPVPRGKSKPGRAYMARRSPDSDSETLTGFAEYVGQHSKTREDIKSWFDALDLDDHVSFGGKA
jgi:hypothetical protein